jgi:hypothetical protein
MKKLIIIVLCIIVGNILTAQDDDFKTIFEKNKGKPLKVSGFGGPMMTFSAIDNNFVHMMGGGGGIILNNFFFGGYGLGMTTPITYKGYENTDPGVTGYNLHFGHGGFWTGYIIGSKKPIHLSVSSLIGWGGISQVDKSSYYNPDDQSGEIVFVVTPIAELELNFSKFFKLGIGSSISFVMGPGIDNTPYNLSDFANPSVYLSFKFGWFQ